MVLLCSIPYNLTLESMRVKILFPLAFISLKNSATKMTIGSEPSFIDRQARARERKRLFRQHALRLGG